MLYTCNKINLVYKNFPKTFSKDNTFLWTFAKVFSWTIKQFWNFDGREETLLQIKGIKHNEIPKMLQRIFFFNLISIHGDIAMERKNTKWKKLIKELQYHVSSKKKAYFKKDEFLEITPVLLKKINKFKILVSR